MPTDTRPTTKCPTCGGVVTNTQKPHTTGYFVADYEYRPAMPAEVAALVEYVDWLQGRVRAGHLDLNNEELDGLTDEVLRYYGEEAP